MHKKSPIKSCISGQNSYFELKKTKKDFVFGAEEDITIIMKSVGKYLIVIIQLIEDEEKMYNLIK